MHIMWSLFIAMRGMPTDAYMLYNYIAKPKEFFVEWFQCILLTWNYQIKINDNMTHSINWKEIELCSICLHGNYSCNLKKISTIYFVTTMNSCRVRSRWQIFLLYIF